MYFFTRGVLALFFTVEIMFYFSLLIMGNITEFERGVLWLSDNLSFDVDARVNLFEVSYSGC